MEKNNGKMPLIGSLNPKNIDALVAAGEMTFAEGEKLKERGRQKQKPISVMRK